MNKNKKLKALNKSSKTKLNCLQIKMNFNMNWNKSKRIKKIQQPKKIQKN